MPVGGTRIYCPRCRGEAVCRAVSPSSLGERSQQRVQHGQYDDIHWFRRGRNCLNCGHSFLTGELDEAFIRELAELRGAWLANIRLKAQKAGRLAEKRSRLETVSEEDAKHFIRATAEWDHPNAWSYVSAPGHARNVYKGIQGWSVDFGANTFLPGLAIARGFRHIQGLMDGLNNGRIVFRDDAIRGLMRVISGCVANQEGNEYGYYPLDGDWLRFGTQLINARKGAEFILGRSDPDAIILSRTQESFVA